MSGEPEVTAKAQEVEVQAANVQPVQQPETNTAAAEPPAQGEGGEQPLSKTAQKKLKRKEYALAKKQEKRQLKKQKHAEQSAARRENNRQKYEQLTEEEKIERQNMVKAAIAARKQADIERKAKLQQALIDGPKIVVDMEFDHLMLEKEQKSLFQQMGYCYNANQKAAVPAHLILTGIKAQVKESFANQINGVDNWYVTMTGNSYMEHFEGKTDELVYLTADSPNELTELDPSKAYIVGGIVDRNRHKGICYQKAVQQGIATARLPIGEYLQLSSSSVMCTNHVVEMLLKWFEVRDWEVAFTSVVPQRKKKVDNADNGNGDGVVVDGGEAGGSGDGNGGKDTNGGGRE